MYGRKTQEAALEATANSPGPGAYGSDPLVVLPKGRIPRSQCSCTGKKQGYASVRGSTHYNQVEDGAFEMTRLA